MKLSEKQLEEIKEKIIRHISGIYEVDVDFDYEEAEYNYGADRDGNRGINIAGYYYPVYEQERLESAINFDDFVTSLFEEYGISESEDLEEALILAETLSDELFRDCEYRCETKLDDKESEYEDRMYDAYQDREFD